MSKDYSSELRVPVNYEVCHITNYCSLNDLEIQEKLNQGWIPITTIVNTSNDVIMYFSRVKNPFKSEN